MDWHALYERYMADEWPVRLRTLASTLAKVSDVVTNPSNLFAVPDMLRESMLMMEWNLGAAPREVLIHLGPMQQEIGLWRQSHESVAQSIALCRLLSYRTQAMSDQVLVLSGLLNQP